MVINLCSGDTPPLTSPRISFSHDLSQSDIHEQGLLRSLPVSSLSSSSSIDFDFCIHESSFNQQSSTAEELFCDGKILPIDPESKQEPQLCNQNSNETTMSLLSESQKSHDTLKCNQSSNETTVSVLSESHDTLMCNQNSNETTGSVLLESHDTLRCNQNSNETTRSVSSESHTTLNCNQKSNETTVSVPSESHDHKQKSSKSSFWQLKRSSSLNCGNGYLRTLCPIPLLSRSNSTGSASSSKKPLSSPLDIHPNSKKQQQKNSVAIAPIKKSHFPHQKPPLIKSGYGSSHGNSNGVRVNPVLNVPTANFLGFGSIFSGNKQKSKK